MLANFQWQEFVRGATVFDRSRQAGPSCIRIGLTGMLRRDGGRRSGSTIRARTSPVEKAAAIGPKSAAALAQARVRRGTQVGARRAQDDAPRLHLPCAPPSLPPSLPPFLSPSLPPSPSSTPASPPPSPPSSPSLLIFSPSPPPSDPLRLSAHAAGLLAGRCRRSPGARGGESILGGRNRRGDRRFGPPRIPLPPAKRDGDAPGGRAPAPMKSPRRAVPPRRLVVATGLGVPQARMWDVR